LSFYTLAPVRHSERSHCLEFSEHLFSLKYSFHRTYDAGAVSYLRKILKTNRLLVKYSRIKTQLASPKFTRTKFSICQLTTVIHFSNLRGGNADRRPTQSALINSGYSERKIFRLTVAAL
jgi:hypothetical protein